jgi:hypothetical protein
MISIRKSMSHAERSGPVVGPSAIITKPMVLAEEEGTHVGLGCSEGPGQKPNVQEGSEKHVGLGRSEKLKLMVGGLGSMKGPDLTGGGGDLISGCDGTDRHVSESNPTEVTSAKEARREGECGQTTPTGCSVNSELQKMVRAAPGCGPGIIRCDRSVVCRPESSWVAGRTGFGPTHTGEAVGQTNMVDIVVMEDDPPALESSEQKDSDPMVVSTDEVIPAGEDKIDLPCSKENEDVLEVYCRRDASPKGKSKVMQSEYGSFRKGDMVETSDQGVGQLNDEKPLVKTTLMRAMEVSKVTGLSCEGQDGRKEECLRCIVVEKIETGHGEDTGTSDFQQAVNNMGRFWGNDSDDEA